MDNTKLRDRLHRASFGDPVDVNPHTRELLREAVDALEAAEAELTRRYAFVASRTELTWALARSIHGQGADNDDFRYYFRHVVAALAAAPVSLEAVEAETTTEWGASHMEGHERAYELSPDRESAEAKLRYLNQGYGWPGENQLVTREVTEWRPVETEGDNRG